MATNKKQPKGKAKVRTSVKKPKGPSVKKIRKSTSLPHTPVPTSTGDRAVLQKEHSGLIVVGLGASAGGLEALEEFFQNMPPESGMAYVVVTHQHPGHTSLLPELLRKSTRMRIVEVTDGQRIESNSIYMGPPGMNLAVLNGTFHLMEPEDPTALRLPIDYFLRSLAEDQKENAYCVILSGTGTDGTLGLGAIKGQGGMTMVQSVQSAKYGGMPQSAVETGFADFVLPVSQIPGQLLDYARGHYRIVGEQAFPMGNHRSEALKKIFVLLRNRTGNDFSNYKASTMLRRIERRMNIHKIETPKKYLRFLQQNPKELDLLFTDMLIGVTNFFRDPDAFQAFAKAATEVLLSKPMDEMVRIWVPGCSTGEEAYSIAIILRELKEILKYSLLIQVFATDLDKKAIDLARIGRYPEGIVSDVNPKRLARFFNKEEGGSYRISQEIREMVIFAPQNIIVDPPFTKLDILSCRNLLIYLDASLQKRLMPLFHYAMRPNGLLFLGPSETTTGFEQLFAVVDKKWKLFTAKEVGPSNYPRFGSNFEMTLPTPLRSPVLSRARIERQPSIPAQVQQVLLDRYIPPSVLVDTAGEVAYIHGRTGAYLEPASGQPSLNIFKMAREGLRLELASVIRQAATQKEEVIHTGIQVKSSGEIKLVNVIARKITEPKALRGLILVMFQTAMPVVSPSEGQKKIRAKVGSKSDNQALERELVHTKETLQSTVEEWETSNEELKSTNEELQSTNEELQSTNEEMETAREELQSLNEELQTVNAQLQMKVDDLSQAHDDIQNLLNSTDVATVFLDNSLNILRFTPQAKKVINLIESDVGRPLDDLTSKVSHGSLVGDAQEVLRTLMFKEAEVQTNDENWYLMRLIPYRSIGDKILGLVLTFVDISQLKHAQFELHENKEKLESIIKTASDAIISIDEDYQIIAFNKAAESQLKFPSSSAIGQSFHLFIPEKLRIRYHHRLKAFGSTKKTHERALEQKGEIWTLMVDGKEVSFLVSISQTFIADQKLFTMILRKLKDLKWLKGVRIEEKLVGTEGKTE